MRKYKSAYLKPYIRKIRNSDKGSMDCDLRTAIRLAMAKECGFKYVLVQRGTNFIIAVDKSKQMIKMKILMVRKNKDFSVWANKIKKVCQYRVE